MKEKSRTYNTAVGILEYGTAFENRLPHRPIDSAKGTGGLDFLIACALLILYCSIFEIIIEKVLDLM